MYINDTMFTVDTFDVIQKLQTQIHIDGSNLLSRIEDGAENIMICCPYHKGGLERRPSCGVRKSDGLMHCFTCNTTRTLPEMISHCLGYPDDLFGKYGWNWLLKNFLSVGVEDRDDITLDLSRDVTKSVVEYVSEDILDTYRYIHPYMYQRKLTDDIIERFDIGYDKDTKCITFPVRDINGNTLFVARRSVNTKYFNYPAQSEKPVYGLYELYQLETFPQEVYICESMLDAHSFWRVGKYACALNGLGTKLQFEQLNKMPCRSFILATDMDEAGQNARKRIRQNIKGKLIYNATFPEGCKDANDCDDEQLLNLKIVL